MTTHVKLGAKKDGTLTAMQVRVVSNTGAYGGHGGETLAAALGSPIAAYRCVNKKADGYAVYTNMVPAGGFRGYGASQSTFAIECAMDDLARLLGLGPFEIRRINKVRETDRIESIWKDPSDVEFGSYGIDQCLDLVETALKSGRGLPKPEGDDWLEGTGVALAMLEFRPADRASLGRRDAPPARRQLSPRGRLHRDGQRLDHVAPPDRRLGARHAREQHRHHQWRHRSDALRHRHFRQHRDGRRRPGGREDCARAPRRAHRLCRPSFRLRRLPIAACRTTAIICANRKMPLAELHAAGAKVGDRFDVRRKAYLSPRSIGFNVHGVRVAVHRVTGEIMTLQSVHAAGYRQADQSHAVPRPARRRHRHGLRLGALREDGLRRATARW